MVEMQTKKRSLRSSVSNSNSNSNFLLAVFFMHSIINWPIETDFSQIAENFQSIHDLPDYTNWR